MKYNLSEHVRKEDDLINFVILEGFKKTLFETVLGKPDDDGDYIVDVKLIVNDKECNVQEFMNNWQSQVNKLITEKAEDLIDDRLDFTEISQLLFELENKIKKVVEEGLYKGHRNEYT